jgi:hypothetical protein
VAAAKPLHFEARPPEGPHVRKYSLPACGSGVGNRTPEHTRVTCKSCRKTRAWSTAAGHLHAYSSAFWPRNDGMLGKRMCGASSRHGSGTDEMWRVTCAHCLDAILDCMVAARARRENPPTPLMDAREPTTCGHCDYEEADGSLLAQCQRCREADGGH